MINTVCTLLALYWQSLHGQSRRLIHCGCPQLISYISCIHALVHNLFKWLPKAGTQRRNDNAQMYSLV